MYFEELKKLMDMSERAINTCADGKDINRNHVNYGQLTAFAIVMQNFGHKVDIPVWEDEHGCLRVPHVSISAVVPPPVEKSLKEENTVTQVIESVREEICTKYCKYPERYSPDEWEEHYEAVCSGCPLDRL